MALNRKTYKWFYDHIHSHGYDTMIRLMTLPFGGEMKCREELLTPVRFSPGERILDICCGTGGATRAISMKAGEDSKIFGLDLSRGQLKHAKRRPELCHVPFVEADAARAPFRDASFDRVFIPHAIHEMPREIRLGVLTEVRRVLRVNGTVIVLEVDDPKSPWLRLFIGFLFFYWLPFNFETPTRRDMLKHGVVNEVREVGFRNITKESKFRGVLQVVQGVK